MLSNLAQTCEQKIVQQSCRLEGRPQVRQRRCAVVGGNDQAGGAQLLGEGPQAFDAIEGPPALRSLGVDEAALEPRTDGADRNSGASSPRPRLLQPVKQSPAAQLHGVK